MSESKRVPNLRETFVAAAALVQGRTTDSVADRYNTILGPVLAVRVKEENLAAVAAWCTDGTVCTEPTLDAPDEVRYISLVARNNHDRLIADRAEIGEWVVQGTDGQFTVYEDKRFLKLIVDKDVKIRNVLDLEGITKLVTQAMEYQDHVTQRGGGVEETADVAEFVALQISKLLR